MEISQQNLVTKILSYVAEHDIRFLFVGGNGGAGKTTLSKFIAESAKGIGHVNTLSVDDFVVDTKLRNSAVAEWAEDEVKKTGRYTTALEGSYLMQSVKAVLFNLEKGNDYWHWPKRVKSYDECILMKGDALFTVVEGVGTAFLDVEKSNVYSIFMTCSKDLEMQRRLKRGISENEQSMAAIEEKFEVRNGQYRAFVEPQKTKYSLEIESLGNDSFLIKRDGLQILE